MGRLIPRPERTKLPCEISEIQKLEESQGITSPAGNQFSIAVRRSLLSPGNDIETLPEEASTCRIVTRAISINVKRS